MTTTVQALNRWQVGDVRITRIVELESLFPPDVMMVGTTPEQIKTIDWLHPHYADADITCMRSSSNRKGVGSLWIRASERTNRAAASGVN